MDFKTIGFNAAVAAAVVASSVLALAPAQAATIGSKLDFRGLGFADTSTPKIDFLNNDFSDSNTGQFSVLGTSTGSFAGLGIGTIKDIGIPELFSLMPGGKGVGNFLQAGSETFKLTNLTNFASGTVSFEGLFGNGVKGLGTFTVLGRRSSLFNYEGSVTAVAVPTPALLPGLLAMGLGLLRKRKADAIAAVDAEA